MVPIVVTVVVASVSTVVIIEIIEPGAILKFRRRLFGGEPPAILVDEKPISDEYFGMVEMDELSLRKHLKSISPDEETMLALEYFINTYSKSGFLRYLNNVRESDACKQAASVIVCYLLEIPYWNLWTHRFMKKSEARNLIVAIRG